MRTKLLLTALLLALVQPAVSQVQWNFRAVQVDEKDFVVHMTAIMPPTWHIYSVRAKRDVAAHVNFMDNPMVTHLSKTQEQGILKNSGDSDRTHSRYYEGYVSFVKPVRVKDTQTPIALRGFIIYHICNGDEDPRHLRQEFMVILKKEE